MPKIIALGIAFAFLFMFQVLFINFTLTKREEETTRGKEMIETRGSFGQ